MKGLGCGGRVWLVVAHMRGAGLTYRTCLGAGAGAAAAADGGNNDDVTTIFTAEIELKFVSKNNAAHTEETPLSVGGWG